MKWKLSGEKDTKIYNWHSNLKVCLSIYNTNSHLYVYIERVDTVNNTNSNDEGILQYMRVSIIRYVLAL